MGPTLGLWLEELEHAHFLAIQAGDEKEGPTKPKPRTKKAAASEKASADA